jgi:hypothetical protein
VVLAVLLARTLIGDVNSSQQPVGVMPALILMIYGLGAFAPPQHSQWVLAFLVLISSQQSRQAGTGALADRRLRDHRGAGAIRARPVDARPRRSSADRS